MQDQPYTDLLINAPSNGRSLPHLTPAILFDHFKEQQVVLGHHLADNWIFRWFYPSFFLNSKCEEKPPVPLSQILIVAEPQEIATLAKQFPTTLFFTMIEDEEQLEIIEPYEKRLIALKSHESKMHILLKLQNIFFQMLLWETELNRIVLQHGSIGELLDSSTSMIGNFIFVSDNDFNVIAQTSAINPPDVLHKSIIENGCLTQSTIAEKRFRLPEKTFYTRDVSEICPYKRVSYPIHINHSYFGSVSMACNKKPDTAGLRDLFKILIRYIRVICEQEWINQLTYDAPSYFFFERLFQRDPMTDHYITSQMEANKIPVDGHFKIILFDIDPSIDPDMAYKTIRTASTLNNGKIKCFQYQHNIVAFCYGSNVDGQLSHKKTVHELERKIVSQFRINCGVSSVYGGIQNSDIALKQAQIALTFRGAIEREFETNRPHGSKGVYLFEDALLYYLIDPASKDKRFMDFIFSTSVINILWEEDLKNNTNYVALLWIYIQSERNATITAQRLHMHRNTVLYHIDKIQKRFDFDMNNKAARDWLLINFKAFFSTQSSKSLSSLFCENGEEEPSEVSGEMNF